ncbi:MAG: hypothetical protein ACKOFW_19325, partial [Planctomycetaceae bacterium]
GLRFTQGELQLLRGHFPQFFRLAHRHSPCLPGAVPACVRQPFQRYRLPPCHSRPPAFRRVTT